MACTVAVEDSISEHYNNQIRALMIEDPDAYKELLEVPFYMLTTATRCISAILVDFHTCTGMMTFWQNY